MRPFLLLPLFVWLVCAGVPALAQEPPPGSDHSVVTAPPGKDSSRAEDLAAPDDPGETPTRDATAVTPDEAAATRDATAVTTVTEEKTVVTRMVDPGYMKVTVPRLSARGPNLVSAGLGVRAGLSDNTPGGFLFAAQYAWQVSRAFWFDTHFAAAFGGRCDPSDEVGEPTACGGLSGFGADLLAGIMMQWLDRPAWGIPLNPYMRVLTGVSFIVSNGPNDGAAIVVRGAGGMRYSFTDEFAVGVELGLLLGPSFRNDVGSGGFAAFDFLLSAEYSF
jgi:hypothetical protein